MVVNKYDLKKKLDAIINNNSYSLEQKRSIKYAMGIVGVNEDLIMDPNIPSDYMDLYVSLMKKGIDVTKYIMEQWHLKDSEPKDLEKTILADNQKKIELKDANVTEEYPCIEHPKQKVKGRNTK